MNEKELFYLKMDIQELEKSVANIQNLLINYADELLTEFRKRRMSKENQPGKIEVWFLLRETLPKMQAEIILKKEAYNTKLDEININTVR